MGKTARHVKKHRPSAGEISIVSVVAITMFGAGFWSWEHIVAWFN